MHRMCAADDTVAPRGEDTAGTQQYGRGTGRRRTRDDLRADLDPGVREPDQALAHVRRLARDRRRDRHQHHRRQHPRQRGLPVHDPRQQDHDHRDLRIVHRGFGFDVGSACVSASKISSAWTYSTAP